jgi:lysophospholipid acyltransferase (LPLAT)-like uncharacterized protein
LREGLLRLAPPLGRSYLGLVGATTRYRFEGRERVEALRTGGPVIWVFWHNRLLGPVIPHRDQDSGVVISQSKDGEVISRIVGGFGYGPLRGSSSRGGSAVLRAVLRHGRKGRDVAFTPDGPKGPRYRVQPGVIYAARRSGLPVIPLGVGMSRKLVFSSWDRFQVPLPLGTIQLVYGEPFRPGDSADDETACEVLGSELTRVTERADELLGVTSP